MQDDGDPSSTADVKSIVDSFVQARHTARSLSAYPGTVPDSLETAYLCQELSIQRWPDRVAGWKVARIAPAAQVQYPEERLIGPVFARNVRIAQPPTPVESAVFEKGFAAVEAELIIRVAGDPPSDQQNWTLDEAASYVGSVHIGIEVASSPLATLNDLGPGAVISDFGNNWGVIVGPEIQNWRSIGELTVESFIDGKSVGKGVAFIRQGALGALAFTLNKCAQRGRRLQTGDVISTGMITGVHDIRIGRTSRHVFEGCGEVQCRAVKAQPLAP